MSATEAIWAQGWERRARFAPWQISEGATTPWAQIVPSLRVGAKIAACFVARLAHAPRTRSRAAWCGQGRQAAYGCDGVSGLQRLLPQTGLRQTSRSRRDMGCDKRLAIDNFGHNASHAV